MSENLDGIEAALDRAEKGVTGNVEDAAWSLRLLIPAVRDLLAEVRRLNRRGKPGSYR